MTGTYTMEYSFNIYDDSTGDSIYVGPDVDGFDLIEIRYMEAEKILSRICMPREQARLVAEAINKVLNA